MAFNRHNAIVLIFSKIKELCR